MAGGSRKLRKRSMDGSQNQDPMRRKRADEAKHKLPPSKSPVRKENENLLKKRSEKEEEGAPESEDEEDKSIVSRTKLDLSNHPLPPLGQLTRTLSKFANLQRLDLSSMHASEEAGNPQGLTHLRWLGKATGGSNLSDDGSDTKFGKRLTMLNLSGNEGFGKQRSDDKWDGLQRLSNLMVLNATSCALDSVPPPATLLPLSNLTALVLPHNNITTLSHIPHLPNLNTLVLSYNALISLPTNIASNLPSLKKLSLASNNLKWTSAADHQTSSPLPDFSSCEHLREVRLSGNSTLHRLPSHFATWGRGIGTSAKGTGLETLEAGDCGFRDWDAIKPLFGQHQTSSYTNSSDDLMNEGRRARVARGLVKLTLKGNAIAQDRDYKERLIQHFPTMRNLDNDRLEPKKRKSSVERFMESDTGVKPSQNKEDGRRAKSTQKKVSEVRERTKQLTDEKRKKVKRQAEVMEEQRSVSNGTREPENVSKDVDSVKSTKGRHRGGSRGSKKRNGELAKQDGEKVEPATEEAESMKRLLARAGPAPMSDDRDESQEETQGASTKIKPTNASNVKKDRKTKGDSVEQSRIKSLNPEMEEVSAVGGDSEKKKVRKAKEKRGSKTERTSRKKVAWDEDTGASNVKDNKRLREDDDERGAEKRRREATSVAGIVEVRKQGVKKGRGGEIVRKNARESQKTTVHDEKPKWSSRSSSSGGGGGGGAGGIFEQSDVGIGIGGAWD